MKCKGRHFILIFLLLFVQTTSYLFSLENNGDPHFVIVIPSYNNKNWYKRNLDSVLSQDYAAYRVIYLDDCSPDGTGDLVEQYLSTHDTTNKITLIKNIQRKGALGNLYCAIHSCEDNDIIVTLDGDDWFAHEHVLSILSRVYRDSSVWLTYGQYIDLWGGLGCCRKIAPQVINQNLYRKTPNTASHLRTFYAWLFKAIKLEDLLYQGTFFPMTWDWAMMYPMLEMSGGRFKFIPNILYIYNTDNPLNDSRTDEPFQIYLSRLIQQKEPYEPLAEPIVKPSNTAVCSLIVITDNNLLSGQQIIEQLPKQQSTISLIKILSKQHYQQLIENKLFFNHPEQAEFVIIATYDCLASIWPQLDEAITLLQQTQAAVSTFIKTEKVETKKSEEYKNQKEKSGKSSNILQQKLKKNKENKQKLINAHCSPLTKTAYTYQLGWEPTISLPYQEQAYIFSRTFLQEHAEQSLILLNGDFKLNKASKQKFAQRAGLVIINDRRNECE